MTLTVPAEDAPALTMRNALIDFDYVSSNLVSEGAGCEHPLVTIAIPTFGRPELLIDAIRSALAQRFDRPYEIIVVDNDPASRGAATLLEAVPELSSRSFRYFVNSENIGLFPNHNRCIQLARGEWLTILNDDDLLDEGYLRLMFSVLDRNPNVSGLACSKRNFDQRHDAESGSMPLSGRLLKHLLTEFRYTGSKTRRIRPHKFFWAPVLGNVAGFICRTRAAEKIGGFYPEDHPSSDIWFFARFASQYEIRQHRAVAASIRIAQNESAKMGVILDSLRKGYRLQQALAQFEVPRWWLRLAPLLMARHRTGLQNLWRVELSKHELEDILGSRLPPDRPLLHHILRALLRGF